MRSVLVVSDIHVGHHLGLAHPNMKDPWGKPATLNEGQEYLWHCWQHLIGEARERKPSVLVINGDLLDGEGRLSAGNEQSSTITAWQQKMAVKVLEPLAAVADEVWVVRGTPYHDGRLGIDVEPVAAALGARAERGNKDWHSHDTLDLDVDGVILNVHHEIQSGQYWYKSTGFDREGALAAFAGMSGKFPQAKCIVRSHLHYFMHVEHSSVHIVGTPCWQLQTFYMQRKSPYKMIPDLGAVYVEIDHGAHREGEDPITIRKRLYRLPARRAVRSGVKADEE